MARIWIVGGTGLVGRETIKALLADPSFLEVVAFVRRPTGLADPRLDERVIDFEKLEEAFAAAPPDAAVCCLGTTIKAAGSQERFRRVDYDYALSFARAAKQAGAKQFVVVTALGSSSKSRVFYNRVKGELEDALGSLAFESLSIARPSLLIGERHDLRVAERVLAPLSRILPARYRGIEGKNVARAIVRLLKQPTSGKRVVPSERLEELAQQA